MTVKELIEKMQEKLEDKPEAGNKQVMFLVGGKSYNISMTPKSVVHVFIDSDFTVFSLD